MLDTSWSKIINSQLGTVAEAIYSTNHNRFYHEWTHIRYGYDCAKHKFKLDYDVNLDLAWLGHDLVYDNHPDKELRSIEFLHELYENHGPIYGVNFDIVDKLTRTSIDHSSSDDDRLIKMDLAGLTDKKQTAINFELLQSEMKALYGIDDYEHARNTIEFMKKLRTTCTENGSRGDGDYWAFVIRGIDQTIEMANTVLSF